MLKLSSVKSECESRKDSERGAALIMVLMISFLLLVVCIGMLTAAAYNTRNVTDAVGESQAYYAAESGIQATINILRGNKLDNSGNAANRISYKKAITPATSNAAGDSSTVARLSNWLIYDGTYTDRVIVDKSVNNVSGAAYTPQTGSAYQVTVSDPDNSQGSVTYNTSGLFLSRYTDSTAVSGAISNGGQTITFPADPSAVNKLMIDLVPKTGTAVISGGVATNKDLFGVNVRYTIGDNTKPVPLITSTDSTRVQRFQIAYNMTSPYTATKDIRGTITQDTATRVIKVVADSVEYSIIGSDLTLQHDINAALPDATYQIVYVDPLVPGAVLTSSKVIQFNVTPAEPQRLLLKSTGYGPDGAIKQFEAIIKKNFFDDLGAPAALTMIGPYSLAGYPNFNFEPGSSNNVLYSGDDSVVGSTISIPSIGVTTDASLLVVQQNPPKTVPDPPAAQVANELPEWLSSTTELNKMIIALRKVADSSGRLYPAGVVPPNLSQSQPTGITFCDGSVSFPPNITDSGAGNGILIVTGDLELRGGFSFNGLVIVTGPNGIHRSGGGGGILTGNTVIAPYLPNDLAKGFLPPQYKITGGGNSQLTYNSSAVGNGLAAISNFVLGVAEK